MVRLSVNVNKVATLRNSRGGALPSVVDAGHRAAAARHDRGEGPAGNPRVGPRNRRPRQTTSRI